MEPSRTELIGRKHLEGPVGLQSSVFSKQHEGRVELRELAGLYQCPKNGLPKEIREKQ